MRARIPNFDIGRINKEPNAKPKYVPSSNFLPDGVKPIEKKKKSKYAIVPFIAGCLVVILLLQTAVYLSNAKKAQGTILGAATSAYSSLNQASDSLKGQNFADAQTMFNSAVGNLQDAENKLDQFKALELVAPQAKAADHVLGGAKLLAIAGSKLSIALDIFDGLAVNVDASQNYNLTQKLSLNKNALDSSLYLLKQAQDEFDKATDLPDAYAQTVTSAKSQVNALTTMLENLTNLEDIYLGLFNNGPKTYLMVFQNYDEVRATGGFIGTYGVAKVDGGKIQSLKIDSIYDLDGRIYDQIAAPGPFQPEIKKWGIRDANWFADFPSSAKKLLQFYEKGAETADGVIAVTPQIFEDVLTLTGPINMPEYGVTLNADNFQDVVQYKTSIDYDKKLNEPKKFLADFAPVLLNKLASLDKQNWLNMLQMFETNLNQKQIMVYAKDAGLQQKISSLKFSGEILPSDMDYLDVVNTNLGGTKTDLSINQKVNLEAQINSDGTITDVVTITRNNSSVVLNKDFIRILVPLGSTLISSDGFDAGTFELSQAEGFKTDKDLDAWDKGEMGGNRVFVRTESGKTEFSGWTITNPSETKTLTLAYKIPYQINLNLFKPTATYSLLFQKQDGVKPYDFSATIDTGNLNTKWMSSDAGDENGQIHFTYNTGSDQYWAVLLSK